MWRLVNSFFWTHTKAICLVILCVQNSIHSLVMGYSNGILKEKYNPKTVVFMMELAKLVACWVIISYESGSLTRGGRRVWDLSFTPVPWKMAVPALLYYIQNWLQINALKHVSAPLFSVMSQGKLVTTAIFTVLMLGRVVPWRQRRALILLVVGVVLVPASCDDIDAEVCTTPPPRPTPPVLCEEPND